MKGVELGESRGLFCELERERESTEHREIENLSDGNVRLSDLFLEQFDFMECRM